ncbi:odorant receptor 4 [Athalia rosae]|uniref:odorant receptor 4 n=1 Tax=Athalia rosae TaxID=37344 RepID=UPI002033ACD8|nr:odorant receptor 4 [Athalia rosae]
MDECLRYNVSRLTAIGILDSGDKWKAKLKMAVCVISAASMFIVSTIDLIDHVYDFASVAENLSILLVGFASWTKLFIMIYGRDKVIRFVQIIENRKVREATTETDDSIISQYDQMGHRFSKSYEWIVRGAGFLMLLPPLLGFLLDGEKIPPFPAWYPFDVNKSSNYLICFIHQMTITYVVVLTYVAFDSWFVFLVFHASGHLCLLQDWLENFTNCQKNDRQAREKIVRSVRLHQKINQFVADVEEFFSFSNLVQFLLGSVAICISGYQVIVTNSNHQQYLKHICSIIGQTVQLLMINWSGQLIQDKSFGVSLAAARSKLYELEMVDQKDICLVVLQAQKPMYITAGKFYQLSLPNFATLMKTSMSYFTMLRSVSEKN